MKHIPAFSYLYNYYAIPETYASPEEFLADAATRPTLVLTRLCETGCIAPYFIEEETELTHIRLTEPDRVHLIDAAVMPRAEYQARLGELICAQCPGCLHFTPPAEGEAVDTTGHEKEMTLDGLCLLRAEGREPYTLIDAADDFWGGLLDAEDSVRKPLFDGDLTEAADAVSVIYHRCFPCAKDTVIAVNRSIGQRYLMFGALSAEARLINRYLILRAPVEVTEYWMLFDHLPRIAAQYVPLPDYDLRQMPPTVEFRRMRGQGGHYYLNVYCPPAANGVQTARETFRYLCAELGEDLLYTHALDMQIETSPDYAAHRPVSDFLRTIKNETGLFWRRKIARQFSRPFELNLPPVERGSRAAAERLSTMAPGLSLELSGREFDGRLAQMVDEWQVPVCTLALTLPDEATREALTARVCGELAADLQRDGLIALIDIARAGEKLYLDFLAVAAGESIEALRDLTPEFAGMNPILTVRSRTETRVMRVNYTLDTIRRVAAQPAQPQGVVS